MLHRALSICFISVGICITTCQATVRVTETSCTKDASDQCKHTPNAECDNDVSDAKCKCSDGFIEDKTDGSTCVKRTVTETTCTKDAKDQCKHTPNAECDNDVSDAKCKCSDGFKEDNTDGSTCVKIKVTETTCTKDAKDQCKHTPNAECDNADTDSKCKCSDGFKEDKTDGSTCVKIVGTSCTAQNEATVCSLENDECKESECACKPGYNGDTCLKIIGSDCSGSAACPGDANTMCKSGKCECKEGYADKNDVCTQNVDGIDCSNAKTACDNTENAVCDTDNGKCKCKSGYKMDIDKCKMENSAAMTGYGAIVLALSLLASYLRLL